MTKQDQARILWERITALTTSSDGDERAIGDALMSYARGVKAEELSAYLPKAVTALQAVLNRFAADLTDLENQVNAATVQLYPAELAALNGYLLGTLRGGDRGFDDFVRARAKLREAANIPPRVPVGEMPRELARHCSECGALIPADAPTVEGPWHKLNCLGYSPATADKYDLE